MKVTDKESDKKKSSLSCAECRRSKIACDRVFPCQSCIKRGCASLCPNGTMPATKGNKVLLAHSQKLGEHVKSLQNRVRELEAALAASRDDHPLLQPEQLPGSSTDDDVQRVTNAIGMLSIGADGQARYQGDSAQSEFISGILNEDDYETVNIYSLGLPAEIIDLVNTFPFGQKTPSCTKDVFLPWLPTRERAIQMAHLFYQREAWMFCPITEKDFHASVLQPLYENAEKKSLSSYHAHKLALFFALVGIGALFDKGDNAAGPRAHQYIYLSRAALAFHSMLQEVTCATVQAIFLLVRFIYRAEQQRKNEERWVLCGLCSRLASIIGLQRDSAGWELEPEEVERRRLMFWELYIYETSAALAYGRPPALMIQHADTKFPADWERESSPDGSAAPDKDAQNISFHAWKHRWAATVLSNVAMHIFSTRSPSYKAVLELDKRIRNFPIPPHLRSPAVHPVPAGCAWAEDGTKAMQQFCVVTMLQGHLLYIHRSYAGAALRAEGDPLAHAFAPSVLAVYRSSCQIVTGVKDLMGKHQELLAECWFFWSLIFSSCMVLATIVIEARESSLAAEALKYLEIAAPLFEEGSLMCRPPTTEMITGKMLSVARRYYNRELESVDESTKQELCLLGLPSSMRVVRKDGNSSGNASSRGSSQEADLYAAFAGTTNGQGHVQHGLSDANLNQSINFDQSANFFAGMDLSMDMANWQIPDATLRPEGNPSFNLTGAGNGLNNYGNNMPPGVDQLMFGQPGWNGATSDVRSFHQGATDVGSLAGMGSGLGMFSDMPLGIDLVMGMGSGGSMGSGNPSSRDSPGSMGSGSSPYGGLGSGGAPSSGSSSSGQQHYDPRLTQYDVQGLYNISPADGSHDNLAWGAQTGRQGQGQGPSGFM